MIAVRGLFNYSCECTTPSVECLETQLQTSISSSFVFTCPLTDIVCVLRRRTTSFRTRLRHSARQRHRRDDAGGGVATLSRQRPKRRRDDRARALHAGSGGSGGARRAAGTASDRATTSARVEGRQRTQDKRPTATTGRATDTGAVTAQIPPAATTTTTTTTTGNLRKPSDRLLAGLPLTHKTA